MAKSTVRPVVDSELVENVKKAYPEIQGADPTGVVDWALRLLKKQAEAEKAMEP